MIFEILKAVDAKLVSLTNRSEKHGDDDVPAISAWFEMDADNTILDSLGDGQLRSALYYGDDNQADVPGVVKTTPHLRTTAIDKLSIEQKPLEGWTLKINHGIKDDEPITFGGCKVDGFTTYPKPRGSVVLKFRVGTSDISAESLGMIGMKVGHSVSLACTAPKVKPPKATDGGAPLFEGGDKAAEPRKPGAAEKAAVANVKGVVKYRDKATGSTWSGRGLQPTWLKVALSRGMKLSDYEVTAPHKPSATEAKAAAEAAFKPADTVKGAAALSPEAAWPFPRPDRADGSAPPQSVTIERSQPGSRTARGRDATAKALAAGTPK